MAFNVNRLGSFVTCSYGAFSEVPTLIKLDRPVKRIYTLNKQGSFTSVDFAHIAGYPSTIHIAIIIGSTGELPQTNGGFQFVIGEFGEFENTTYWQTVPLPQI